MIEPRRQIVESLLQALHDQIYVMAPTALRLHARQSSPTVERKHPVKSGVQPARRRDPWPSRSNTGALFPLFFTAASATLLGKWMKQMAGDCA